MGEGRPSARLRMTPQTRRVLEVLLDDPAEPRYGLAIGDAALLASGTVHPILARLEGAGWLESQWEGADPSAEGRPQRRYYRLTGDGVELARNALARAEAVDAARAARRSRPVPAPTSRAVET